MHIYVCVCTCIYTDTYICMYIEREWKQEREREREINKLISGALFTTLARLKLTLRLLSSASRLSKVQLCCSG